MDKFNGIFWWCCDVEKLSEVEFLSQRNVSAPVNPYVWSEQWRSLEGKCNGPSWIWRHTIQALDVSQRRSSLLKSTLEEHYHRAQQSHWGALCVYRGWMLWTMGPLIMDTVKEVKSIQQTLWEVSPAGTAAASIGPALVIRRACLRRWIVQFNSCLLCE